MTGKIGRQHLEFRRQTVRQGGEVVMGGSDPVEQQQRGPLNGRGSGGGGGVPAQSQTRIRHSGLTTPDGAACWRHSRQLTQPTPWPFTTGSTDPAPPTIGFTQAHRGNRWSTTSEDLFATAPGVLTLLGFPRQRGCSR